MKRSQQQPDPDSPFRLVGHEVALGPYPAPVVPIVALGRRRYRAFATPTKFELQKLDARDRFVKHRSALSKRLRGFVARSDALFAFRRDDVVMYHVRDEFEFLLSILVSDRSRIEDPFQRLAIARSVCRWDLLDQSAQLCFDSLYGRSPEAAEFWAKSVLRPMYTKISGGRPLPTGIRRAIASTGTMRSVGELRVTTSRSLEEAIRLQSDWRRRSTQRRGGLLEVVAHSPRTNVIERLIGRANHAYQKALAKRGGSDLPFARCGRVRREFSQDNEISGYRFAVRYQGVGRKRAVSALQLAVQRENVTIRK